MFLLQEQWSGVVYLDILTLWVTLHARLLVANCAAFHRTDKNKHVPALPKAINSMFCKRCGVGNKSKHYKVGHE